MPPYVLPIDPNAKPTNNHGPGPDPNPIGRRLEEYGREQRDDENLDPNLTALASPGDAFEHGGPGLEPYGPLCDTCHIESECPVKPIPVPKAVAEPALVPNHVSRDYKTQTVGQARLGGCVYRQELVRLSDGAILASLSPNGVVKWVDRGLFTAKERIAIRKALAKENTRWKIHQRAQAKAEATRAAIRSGDNPLLHPVVVSVPKRGPMPAATAEDYGNRDHPQTCTYRLYRPNLYPGPRRVAVHAEVPCFEVDELREPD